MNSWMLFVYPNPGMTSAQNSGTTTRNCASDVQKRTDTSPTWVWSLPCIFTTFSSTTKAVAPIPFEKIKTLNRQFDNLYNLCLHLNATELIIMPQMDELQLRFLQSYVKHLLAIILCSKMKQCFVPENIDNLATFPSLLFFVNFING